jgi:GTP-binding protein Era
MDRYTIRKSPQQILKEEKIKVTVELNKQKQRIEKLNREKRPALRPQTEIPILAKLFQYKPPEQPVNPRLLRISIIGEPNAGKSTLINRLVGTKISAVSTKSHTTRSNILGIVTTGETQLCFIDTPGMSYGGSKTIKRLLSEAREAILESDLVMVVVDSVKSISGNKNLQQVFQNLSTIRENHENVPPYILVLNKIDLVAEIPESTRKPVIDRFVHHFPNLMQIFSKTFTVSALNGKNVMDLQSWLTVQSKSAPWEYHHSTVTPRSDIEIAEEIVREKLYQRLNQELPYQLFLNNTGWTDLPDGSLLINMTINVRKDAHKRSVYGQKGRGIYSITQTAEQDLTAHFQRKVLLRLHVKVYRGPDVAQEEMM